MKNLIMQEFAWQLFISQDTGEIILQIVLPHHYVFVQCRCGPCEMLDLEFEKFPQKYPRAVFIKVDVEKCFDTVAELEISVIPTFILYRNKVTVIYFSYYSILKNSSLV